MMLPTQKLQQHGAAGPQQEAACQIREGNSYTSSLVLSLSGVPCSCSAQALSEPIFSACATVALSPLKKMRGRWGPQMIQAGMWQFLKLLIKLSQLHQPPLPTFNHYGVWGPSAHCSHPSPKSRNIGWS